MKESESRTRVLYAEDDPASARIVQALLEKEGYRAEVVATAKECLARVATEPPDVLLLDLSLPDASGLDVLEAVRSSRPALPVIIVTASEAIEDVIGAMRRGAVDYLNKPVDARRMAVSVANALRLKTQEREISRLRADVDQAWSAEHMVGSSAAMDRVRQLIRRAASSEATVLIIGESGTGKELVARALHASGPRASAPFIDVNSAALTESLLESELFGHEKGAFTSAVAMRRGKFEQAHGGTLFLDEIGDMPLPTQAKMLRVLQERSFQRVGGDARISVNVRVVCATNRTLENDVEKGTFRRDLFYRINTLVIEIPSLRERAADIPELARHFLARCNRVEKRAVQDISAPAMQALIAHSWPGNVRELQHAVERAVLVCEGDEIRPEHLPPAVMRSRAPEAPPGQGSGLIESVERLERSMILAALEKHGWIRARAARALGITERVISYKMNILGIQKQES